MCARDHVPDVGRPAHAKHAGDKATADALHDASRDEQLLADSQCREQGAEREQGCADDEDAAAAEQVCDSP